VTTAPLLASAWPVTSVGVVVTVLSLALALVTGVLAALNRRITRWVLALVAVLELALLVLTVQLVLAWAGGNAPEQPVVLLAYLLVVLVAAPGTVWWGAAEPGRWGTGVVCVACLLIPVLLVRLQQVWDVAAAVTGHA
jgi:amino acid transporter